MKYFIVFFIVALAAIVSAQQAPVAPRASTLEEGDVNPAELGAIPEEISRDKRGLGFGVYAYQAPYYYGGYKSFYRAPAPYYPYSYGFRKYYYY